MEIKIKKLHPGAKMPTYATDGSTAFDLYALAVNSAYLVGDNVYPGHSALCRTGLAFEIPEGHGMFILSRSGHGFNFDTRLANCVGLLDFDYRGEAMVKLTCDHEDDERPPLYVRPGDRIAQAVIIPVPRVNFTFADDLSNTARGTGGFGSTGKD